MSEYQLYKIILICFLGLSALAFAAIFFIPVPYGRHNRPGWGPQIKAFLGWFFMESPSFFVFAIVFALSPHRTGPAAWIFFGLWEGHYIQRSLVYPFLMRGKAKTMPLVIVLMACSFTSLNSYLNGRWLFRFSGGYDSAWLKDPRFIAGAALFLIGFAINIQSDSLLRRLRPPSETGYKIPRGGLFRYVSCANYFGEIIEWFGWALATWSLPGLAFAVWTVANLAPRAFRHHRWYRRSFPDYPRDRKALIPFLI
jgi:protein-S-isoprenylcysteine O-methyltransferase Ste14